MPELDPAVSERLADPILQATLRASEAVPEAASTLRLGAAWGEICRGTSGFAAHAATAICTAISRCRSREKPRILAQLDQLETLTWYVRDVVLPQIESGADADTAVAEVDGLAARVHPLNEVEAVLLGPRVPRVDLDGLFPTDDRALPVADRDPATGPSRSSG